MLQYLATLLDHRLGLSTETCMFWAMLLGTNCLNPMLVRQQVWLDSCREGARYRQLFLAAGHVLLLMMPLWLLCIMVFCKYMDMYLSSTFRC